MNEEMRRVAGILREQAEKYRKAESYLTREAEQNIAVLVTAGLTIIAETLDAASEALNKEGVT